MSKYWMLSDIYECSLCGKYTTYRTRMYTTRPENYCDRHIYHTSYDWCQESICWHDKKTIPEKEEK